MGHIAVAIGSPSSIDELHRLLVGRLIGVSSTITVIRHTQKLDLIVEPEELIAVNQKN